MTFCEATFQSLFNRWKAVHMRYTCCEELKICKENRFNLSCVADHQLANLKNAKHSFIQFKIPDMGNQNPFDSFSLCGVPAHLVILFYKPRKPKNVYVIDIDTVIGVMEDDPKKKSLTEEECANLSKMKLTL